MLFYVNDTKNFVDFSNRYPENNNSSSKKHNK